MSHELPSLIKIYETSQLAMVASIKRNNSSLGMSSTSSWFPKPKIGLVVGFGDVSVILHLAMFNDPLCGIIPPEMVVMVGCCSYISPLELAWTRNE
jgi:hypothetical protein